MDKSNQNQDKSSQKDTTSFTSDFKSTNFTDPFATDTNTVTDGVSEIFRDDNLNGENQKKKFFIIGGLVIVFVVSMMIYFMSEKEQKPSATDEDFLRETLEEEEVDPIEKEIAVDDLETPKILEEEIGMTPSEEITTDDSETLEFSNSAVPLEEEPEETTSSLGMGDSLELHSPSDGQSFHYNEQIGGIEFSWQSSESATLVFSRSANMDPVYKSVAISGNSYFFRNPYPGLWYWQIQSPDAASEIYSVQVLEAIRRNIELTNLADGATITTDQEITWRGDEGTAYYRIELTNSGWTNPSYRFATGKNSLQIQDISVGSYQLRCGGFSEISGRWEYTHPINVNVQ